MNLGHLYVVRTTLTKPPKDKLAICVCEQSNFFIWINTNPRSHGDGQMRLLEADHGALSHDCYLDCSRITTFLPAELGAALDRGRISSDLAAAIADFIDANPPKALPAPHRVLILNKLATLI